MIVIDPGEVDEDGVVGDDGTALYEEDEIGLGKVGGITCVVAE